MRERGLSRFGRFFLPQRLARRGLDRRRPFLMSGAMLRIALAAMARQLGMAPR